MAVQIDGSQGNVIATKGTYSGSVSIGGTLTYEDVTNIDSVGIITARTSIEVGARPGVGASISSDGNAIFSGITTITQLGGSPKLTSGQTITSTANDGNASIQGGLTYPGGHIRLGGGSGDDDIRFSVSGGSGTLSEKARITSGGDLTLGNTSVAFPSGTGLQVYHASAPRIKLANSTSGVAAADGFQIYTSGAAAFLDNKENGEMRFYTNATENARIDTSGRLLVGATAKRNVLNQNGNSGGDSVTPYFYAEGTGDSKALTLVSNNTNAWRGSVLGLARTRGTSVGDSTVVQDDDNIGQIVFAGGDGTDIECNAATIKADIDGTPGANDMPGRLVFSTTADGAVVSTERLRIDCKGNMGLGETDISPVGGTYKAFDVAYKGTGLSGRTDNPTLDIRSNLYYDGSNWKYGEGSTSAGVLNIGGNQMIFYTAPAGTAGNTATLTEKFKIDTNGTLTLGIVGTNHGTTSGVILANYTDAPNNVSPGTIVCSTTDIPLITNHSDSTDGIAAVWRKGGSSKGNVSISGNTTTYNTSSDYRLKENEVAISDGITRLKLLKPYRFNWKSNPSKTVDGFFAHEVTPVVPEAVNGEKDADPGDAGMGYQTMDHAKLVPLLTAALQEAIAKIETLESEMDALKSS